MTYRQMENAWREWRYRAVTDEGKAINRVIEISIDKLKRNERIAIYTVIKNAIPYLKKRKLYIDDTFSVKKRKAFH